MLGLGARDLAGEKCCWWVLKAGLDWGRRGGSSDWDWGGGGRRLRDGGAGCGGMEFGMVVEAVDGWRVWRERVGGAAREVVVVVGGLLL